MSTNPSDIYYIPSAPPIRLYCASKPTIQSLASDRPGSPPRPGSRLVVKGTNLSWVTQVTERGTGLTFGVVSDNQLWADIPVPTWQQQPSGQYFFQPNFASRFGTTTIQPMLFRLPPVVMEAKGQDVGADPPMPVEPGGTLEIWGYGLNTQTMGLASVVVDNIPAPPAAPGSQGSIRVTVPAGVTHGTFVVSNPGGSATGTFTLMTGPSILTGVSPSDATAASRVRVTGANLLRARGVCFNNAVRGQPDLMQRIYPIPPGNPQTAVIRLWNNTDAIVTVPAGASSGRLGLYLPTSPAATAYACVPSNVRLQVR